MEKDRHMIITHMLSKGLDLKEASELTGISLEEITKISKAK